MKKVALMMVVLAMIAMVAAGSACAAAPLKTETASPTKIITAPLTLVGNQEVSAEPVPVYVLAVRDAHAEPADLALAIDRHGTTLSGITGAVMASASVGVDISCAERAKSLANADMKHLALAKPDHMAWHVEIYMLPDLTAGAPQTSAKPENDAGKTPATKTSKTGSATAKT